jgi:hypothetical protein
MTTVRTDLGNTKESARRERFEPTGSITATNVQKAIEQAVSQPIAIVPTAVAFAASPYTVLATDVALYVDPTGGAITINLQASAARAGVPLIIKDVTGHAAANNISLVGNGAETTDSLATYLINADFGGVTLNPLTGGYTVAP